MHGGVIMLGFPMVLIGGQPAARVGDMHMCPMLTPGVPPIPHVGGPVTMGFPMVLIGGQPAARMGDMLLCAGPPDSIAMGCPTVLIGDGGGGGGASGGGAAGNKANVGSAAGSAMTHGGSVASSSTIGSTASACVLGAKTSAQMAGPEPQTSAVQSHYVDVTFVDQANLPVGGVKYSMKTPENRVTKGLLGGPVKRRGIQQGNYEFGLRGITNARWSTAHAQVGDTVEIVVETVGVDTGTKALLSVYVRDSQYADRLLCRIPSSVNNNKVKESWKFEVDDQFLVICAEKKDHPGYSRPFFFFAALIDDLEQRSGLLFFKDWLEIKLVGKDGKPASGQKYLVRLPNGQILNGVLDGNGHAKIDNVYPSQCQVEFPDFPDVAPQ